MSRSRKGNANRKFKAALSRAKYPRMKPRSRRVVSGTQASTRIGGAAGAGFDNGTLNR